MIMNNLFSIGVLIMMFSCTAKAQPVIVKLENGLYSISYENRTILINPATGARIVSAKVGEKELLLQERKELLNYGATFWPSPQSNWNWPPPHAFHFGPYSVELSGDKLVLTSEPDPKLGLQVVKTFSYNPVKKCLEVLYQIINKTPDTVSVGPWEIVCVPAVGSKVFFAPGDSPEGVKNSLEFEHKSGIDWFEYYPEKLASNHKLFNNAKEGWLAYINSDRLFFVKTFSIIPAHNLPPGQGNVEVYVSKQMEYIELENHGGYAHLAPDDSLEYRVSWYLSELPKSIDETTYTPELIEHVRSLIK